MRSDIKSLSKKELQDIVYHVYDNCNSCKQFIEKSMSKACGGKYKVTPYDVAMLHKRGYSLSDIVVLLNKEYVKKNIRDTNGDILKISIQVVRQKLAKYEKETGETVYRPASKGRKKGVKNGETYRDTKVKYIGGGV